MALATEAWNTCSCPPFALPVSVCFHFSAVHWATLTCSHTSITFAQTFAAAAAASFGGRSRPATITLSSGSHSAAEVDPCGRWTSGARTGKWLGARTAARDRAAGTGSSNYWAAAIAAERQLAFAAGPSHSATSDTASTGPWHSAEDSNSDGMPARLCFHSS